MKTWTRIAIWLLVLMLTLGCGLIPTAGPTVTPAPTETVPPLTPTPKPPSTPLPVEPTLGPTSTAVPPKAPTDMPLPPQSPTDTPLPQPSPAFSPAPDLMRIVKVTTLACTRFETGTEGMAHTTTITVRRNTEPGLRVAFFNSEVEGIGSDWRASGWTAITLSSLLLGINPEYVEFTLDPGLGWISGPSAGGLTTIGVLAALLGDTVREDAAMTGTINPDGTIGPVGCIPHKIEGAAALGKTLVLVPASQETDYDDNLQQEVNLVEAGNKLGVEVRHVANVFEAYEILTGKPLPRPEASGTSEFPPRASDKLRASALSWLGRYDEARGRFDSLSPEAREDREPTYGDEQAQLADQALSSGFNAIAHQKAWEAAYDAETSLQAATLDEVYYQRGLDSLIDQLNATAASRTDLQAVFERLLAEQPRTASEVVSLMDAWSNLAVAWVYNAEGNTLAGFIENQRDEVDEDTLLDWIYEATYHYVSASLYLEEARNSLDFGMGFGNAPVPDPARIKAMAELLRRAAHANLTLFESVIVEPQAKRNGVSLETMKGRYRDWDQSYANAIWAQDGMWAMGGVVTEEPAHSMLVLGTSLTTWAESTMLIAKYYSLGAELDEEANVIGIAKEPALAEMLKLSESRAAELINLVRDEDPVSSMYYAENALAFREGDPAMQLVALYYNWQAAAEAQVLAYFTGDYEVAIREELRQTGRPADLLEQWSSPAP